MVFLVIANHYDKNDSISEFAIEASTMLGIPQSLHPEELTKYATPTRQFDNLNHDRRHTKMIFLEYTEQVQIKWKYR